MIERDNPQCIFVSATEFVDWKHAHPPHKSPPTYRGPGPFFACVVQAEVITHDRR